MDGYLDDTVTIDLSTTLFETFQSAAEENADRPTFTFLSVDSTPTAYSYGRLFERVEQISSALKALQLPSGALVGILLEKQEGQVLHYLAALGCRLLPAILTPPNRKLDRQHYLATIRAVLDYCRFAAVVTDIENFEIPCLCVHPDQLLEGNPKTRCDRNESSTPAASADERQRGNRADAALLQFSSGTTGIKRRVLLSDRAVLEQLLAYSTAMGLNRRDRIVNWLPLYHNMGFITSLNMPLALGVHSIMMQPLDRVANPGMYLQAVSEYRATLGWHPNFAFSFMSQRVRDRDLQGLDLSSLRGLVNCSEPVTKESQDRFRKRFASLGLRRDVFWGCYAMAETAFALTHGTSADPRYLDGEGPTDEWSRDSPSSFVSVSRSIHGVELIVAGKQDQPLADRRLGELLVKSPFNSTGYYNNPEATTNTFSAGCYRTGDLEFRVGTELYVCGRKKDLLIVGSVNVCPQDVEEMVSQIPGIQPGRDAVFSLFDPRAQTERVIVLAEPEIVVNERTSLMIAVRQRILACFQIANFDVELIPPGWLIKSSSGKLARGANRDKWLLSGRRQPAGFGRVKSGESRVESRN